MYGLTRSDFRSRVCTPINTRVPKCRSRNFDQGCLEENRSEDEYKRINALNLSNERIVVSFHLLSVMSTWMKSLMGGQNCFFLQSRSLFLCKYGYDYSTKSGYVTHSYWCLFLRHSPNRYIVHYIINLENHGYLCFIGCIVSRGFHTRHKLPLQQCVSNSKLVWIDSECDKLWKRRKQGKSTRIDAESQRQCEDIRRLEIPSKIHRMQQVDFHDIYTYETYVLQYCNLWDIWKFS